METPKLDALMETVTREPSDINELFRHARIKAKRDALFGTHGPALVAALKELAEYQACSARTPLMIGMPYEAVSVNAQKLLTRLEQKAG